MSKLGNRMTVYRVRTVLPQIFNKAFLSYSIIAKYCKVCKEHRNVTAYELKFNFKLSNKKQWCWLGNLKKCTYLVSSCIWSYNTEFGLLSIYTVHRSFKFFKEKSYWLFFLKERIKRHISTSIFIKLPKLL